MELNTHELVKKVRFFGIYDYAPFIVSIDEYGRTKVTRFEEFIRDVE